MRVPISDPLRQPTLIVIDPYGDQKPAYVQSFIAMLFTHLQDLGPENFAVATPAMAQSLMIKPPLQTTR